MNFAHADHSGRACMHSIKCSMLSSLQPHFRRHDLSGLVGWRLRALMARWRSLRHAFSSVGSERGVPIEVQTVFHGMGKGGASRDFHACSKFGRLGEV